MRLMTIESAEFSLVFGVDMATIGTIEVGGAAMVAAGFGRVPPGGETTLGRHDEAEAFVVVDGHGEVSVDSRPHPVAPGAVLLLEPFERHVLRNLGAGDLRFVNLCWRNPTRAAQAARRTGRERFAERPVFVFSPPLPPTGDVQLGARCGPPLGADAFVRFQRMNGVEAYHLTGSDDHQHAVARRARMAGGTPAAAAARHAQETLSALALMDVAPDLYATPAADPAYPAGLRAFVSRLVSSGGIVRGMPPGRDSLPVHALADAVREHQRRGKVSPQLRRLAGRILARGTVHIPLTHRSAWGVHPDAGPQNGQVVWSRLAMAYGFLHAIAALGRRLGRDWAPGRPCNDWKVVHFLGGDGAFHHTVLYPALYALAHPDWMADVDYNAMGYVPPAAGKRPARQPPIRARDVLTPETVDAVRYYLASAHAGTGASEFDFAAFRRKVAETLIGRWQAWLGDLGARTTRHFGGRAPDPGSWTPGQSAFLGRLQNRLGAVTVSYGADGFALDGAVRELDGLVDDTIRFAAEHRPLASEPSLQEEWRTTVALELAAARLLAACAAPVMPRFAGRLAEALGGTVPAEWPETVCLVPPGTRLALEHRVFFSVSSLARPPAGVPRAPELIVASA
ncbi:class I tRNA ligase family protein [Arenibaculum sp.]|jgi:methionyl-tRNA synthetase|uniref:class I tRNA ligase family protein n=1 Tax=Arenibaculum sp. TaxID=2865862 RepID=UPI002E13A0DF|nr:class I tRNA ligase family protein [Arenibaculum sp.]